MALDFRAPIVPSVLRVRDFQTGKEQTIGSDPLPPTSAFDAVAAANLARAMSMPRAGQRLSPAMKQAGIARPDTAPAPATPAAPPAPMGFFDRLPSPMSPAGRGLGAAAATLLQASGYSPTPVTLGQALGAAGAAGMEAMTAAEAAEAQRLSEEAQRQQDFYIKMLEMEASRSKRELEAQGKEFDRERNLRTDFSKRSKTFDAALEGFEKVQKAALDPNPDGASDLALIFGFMKTIDPGSVVREGEFATAENSGGISAKLRNTYNKLLLGSRLDPETRARFIKTARRQFEPVLQRQIELENQYTALASGYGLDPENVILSRLPRLGSMSNPHRVDTKDEALNLPSGSYAYIAGEFARID